ncbi:hypothetical protein HK405_012649 [Cladochytrium tenue]|nr:hypothetical protein HK405_012649 [Cladochytrium tenue]
MRFLLATVASALLLLLASAPAPASAAANPHEAHIIAAAAAASNPHYAANLLNAVAADAAAAIEDLYGDGTPTYNAAASPTSSKLVVTVFATVTGVPNRFKCNTSTKST